MKRVSRRDVLASSAALAAVAGLGGAARVACAEEATDRGAGLPERTSFVIRGAALLTMDDALGILPEGSIHVQDGRIVAVGRDVSATAAQEIDGHGAIVLPGLVDTHWHLWNTILRSAADEAPGGGYFPTLVRYGRHMTPEALHASSRLAAAEAIASGITTVTNWCHNARSREHAEADVRAMTEAGLRGRFYCGWAQGQRDDEPVDVALVEGLRRDWSELDGGGLLELGFGWRGMVRASPLPEAVYRADFEAARALELPISVHVGSSERAKGQVGALARAGFLGPDVQIVHALSATPEEIAQVASAGASFSATPGSEMRIGFGLPQVGSFLRAGVPSGVGVDSVTLTGTANLLEILKWTRNVEKAKARRESAMPAIEALDLGTREGARSLGLGDRVGSLTPGRRADLVMLTTDGLNMGVVTNLGNTVVECTTPADVDTVVVDGRILKRGGVLTHLDRDRLVREAREALAETRRRAEG